MESKIKSKKCSALYCGPHLRDAFICNYTLDNSSLSSNKIYKDLGILTLNHLQFSSHCYHIVQKVHSRCNLILRVFPHS